MTRRPYLIINEVNEGRRSCASSKFGGVRECIIGNLKEAHRNKGKHIKIFLIVWLTYIGV